MKKIIGIFLLIISVVVMSGCVNTKTLTCSYTTETENYGKEITTYEMTFKDDLISEFNKSNQLELDEAMESYFDMFYASFEALVEEYKETDGLTATIENENNVIIFNLKVIVSELSSENLEDVEFNKTWSYDEAKSYFEESGYTCN